MRRRARRRFAPSPTDLEHFATGRQHLLAGFCRYCDGVDGAEVARQHWPLVRDAVMADWSRHSFPFGPWATYALDGEKFPDPPPGTTHLSLIGLTWRTLAFALANPDAPRPAPVGRFDAVPKDVDDV